MVCLEEIQLDYKYIVKQGILIYSAAMVEIERAWMCQLDSLRIFATDPLSQHQESDLAVGQIRRSKFTVLNSFLSPCNQAAIPVDMFPSQHPLPDFKIS